MKLRSINKLFCVLCFSATQAQADYIITKIADQNDPGFDDFPDFARPSINNSGVVAFKSELDSGEDDLYLSTDITTPLLAGQDFNSPAVISDSGNVFISMATYDAITEDITSGVYDVAGATWIDSSVTETYSDVAVNASDVTAFRFSFAGGDEEIAMAPPLSTVTDTSGPINSVSLPDINDSGVVSYVERRNSGYDVYISTASNTSIFDSSALIPSVVINNSGTVAYTDQTIVGTNSGGTLLDSTGYYNNYQTLSINNNGDIAFYSAVGASGDTAIYVRMNDGTMKKVVDTSDGTFLGAEYPAFSIGQQAINDAGEVTFWGRGIVEVGGLPQYLEGIYKAIPESSVLLGDINNDGFVDTADNLLMIQIILGTKTPDGYESFAADMNSDSLINAGDMILHTQTTLGLI